MARRLQHCRLEATSPLPPYVIATQKEEKAVLSGECLFKRLCRKSILPLKRHTTGRRNVGKVQLGTFDRGPKYVQLFGARRSCRCPIRLYSPLISPHSVLYLSLSFRKRKLRIISCRYPIKLNFPFISPHFYISRFHSGKEYQKEDKVCRFMRVSL